MVYGKMIGGGGGRVGAWVRETVPQVIAQFRQAVLDRPAALLNCVRWIFQALVGRSELLQLLLIDFHPIIFD